MEKHKDLKTLADAMDAKFKLPMGIKIGWDAILGFIPGIGDIISNVVSFYILVRAALAGCPPVVIIRMGLNILVDNIVDIFPLLGNFFDIFWKSNLRNIKLIEAYLKSPQKTRASSKIIVWVSIVTFLALMIGSMVLTIYLGIWIYEKLSQMYMAW